MHDDQTAILALLQDYFDGFYTGDVGKLQGVFHANCHLYSATDGALQDDDMPAVYARVANREPPAERRQPRKDRVLTIDQAAPELALAKVQLAIGPKLFTDYLSLMRIDGRWQIIAKAYSYVANDET